MSMTSGGHKREQEKQAMFDRYAPDVHAAPCIVDISACHADGNAGIGNDDSQELQK